MRRAAALLAAGLALSACASTTETNPGRTATEQLLLARAADRAVEGLSLPLPAGAAVYVDESYFQGEGARYAISAIRAALSDAGFRLAQNKDAADAVFEIRAGAHTGEITRAEHGVAGLGVHVAARVAAMAGANEVWASSTVKDLTAGSGLTFEDAGEHELKRGEDDLCARVQGPGPSRSSRTASDPRRAAEAHLCAPLAPIRRSAKLIAHAWVLS